MLRMHYAQTTTHYEPLTISLLRQNQPIPMTHHLKNSYEVLFKMVEPLTPQTYINLPYIKGKTEQLTRTPRQHDITVTTKPLQDTVWRLQLVLHRRNGESI